MTVIINLDIQFKNKRIFLAPAHPVQTRFTDKTLTLWSRLISQAHIYVHPLAPRASPGLTKGGNTNTGAYQHQMIHTSPEHV